LTLLKNGIIIVMHMKNFDKLI